MTTESAQGAATAATKAFPTEVLTSRDVTVVRREGGDIVSTESVEANDSFVRSRRFAPLRVRESAGLDFRIVDRGRASLTVRGGISLRQNLRLSWQLY